MRPQYAARRLRNYCSIWFLTPNRGLEVVPISRTRIFSGQADASWGLKPSAFRDNGKRLAEHGRGYLVTAEPPNEDERDEMEWQIMRDFVKHADRATVLSGLPPEMRDPDEPVYRPASLRLRFPPAKWRDIVALMQHYGLPTRYLDWTYNPLTACYFAASDAVQNCASRQPCQRTYRG